MTEDLTSKIRASFVISGDDLKDPNIITDIIGIMPSKVLIKGSKRSAKRPPVPLSEWVLDTGWIKSDNIEVVIKKLIDSVLKRKSDISEFVMKNTLKVTIVCSIEIYNDKPEIHLSSNTIRKIGTLGASVGFDIYDFSDGENVTSLTR